jgi:hypothetical protein
VSARIASAGGAAAPVQASRNLRYALARLLMDCLAATQPGSEGARAEGGAGAEADAIGDAGAGEVGAAADVPDAADAQPAMQAAQAIDTAARRTTAPVVRAREAAGMRQFLPPDSRPGISKFRLNRRRGVSSPG